MEAELARRSNDFRAVLQDYGVPIVDTEAQGTTCE
jgi:hypothetical protein